MMGYVGIILGLYCCYKGIMDKKMASTIVYWGYIGMMEKKMETTIWGLGEDSVWGTIQKLIYFRQPQFLKTPIGI